MEPSKPGDLPSEVGHPEYDAHVQAVLERHRLIAEAKRDVVTARSRLASIRDSRLVGECGYADEISAQTMLYVSLERLNELELERSQGE